MSGASYVFFFFMHKDTQVSMHTGKVAHSPVNNVTIFH